MDDRTDTQESDNLSSAMGLEGVRVSGEKERKDKEREME